MKRTILTLIPILSLGSAAYGESLIDSSSLWKGVFDTGIKVDVQRVLPQDTVPPIKKVKSASSLQAVDQAPAPTRESLLKFREDYSGRILRVPGVVGVYVTKNQPALVITLGGKIAEFMVRRELLRQVPELSSVPFRLDMSGGAPREDEVRCWLPEGC